MTSQHNPSGSAQFMPDGARNNVVESDPSPSLVNVAVYGTGSIGMRHLDVLRRLGNLSPIALPKRLGRLECLEEQGYPTASSLEEATQMGASHCIIATNTSDHVADSLEAMNKGMDLLVEKPLSTDSIKAAQVVRSARSANRRVSVGCVLRFSESLNTFRDHIEDVGRLHSVSIHCQSYLPDWRPDRPYLDTYSARPEEGGVLLDLIHEIDYAGWIFGWPTAVQATLGNLGRLDIEAEETAHLIWETPDHCLITVTLDYLSSPSRRGAIATGELGTVEWNGISGIVTLALKNKPVLTTHSSQTRDEMFWAQDSAFIRPGAGDLSANLASGEDGRLALAVCDAARAASENRREERVEYN